MTKARSGEKGDPKAANDLRTKADRSPTRRSGISSATSTSAPGRWTAIATFPEEREGVPRSWNAWDSLAEAYATKGDKRRHRELHESALDVEGQAQKKRIEAALAKLR